MAHLVSWSLFSILLAFPQHTGSAALVHAVYLKIASGTLFFASVYNTLLLKSWNGSPPDLSHLRVFGSLITARIPGARPAKLDRHTYDGIFLGYSGSDKNVLYIDIHSGRIKIGSSFTFDEAHFTSSKRPPGPQFLFDLGLHQSTILEPHTEQLSTTIPAAAPEPPFPMCAPMIPPLRASAFPLPFGENFTPPPSNAFLLLVIILQLLPLLPFLLQKKCRLNCLGILLALALLNLFRSQVHISKLAWKFNLIPFVDAFA
jgi:hypothetical protein